MERMLLFRAALIVLVIVNTLATAHAIAAIGGATPMDLPLFAMWLVALTSANAFLLRQAHASWQKLSLQSQAMVLMWGGIGLWYWTVAPFYFLLTMQLTPLQLAWSAFAFFWEVPVLGAGLFMLMSAVLFRPFQRYLDQKQPVQNPLHLYRSTFWYPLSVAAILFSVSVLGYAVGAAQLTVFTGLSRIEQIKDVANGAVIALFLSVFFYLVLDTLLGRVRGKLTADHPGLIFPSRKILYRIAGSTAVVILGCVALLGLVVFSVFQSLEGVGSDTVYLWLLLEPQALMRLILGALLVISLTVGLMIFVSIVFTRTLRSLRHAVSRAGNRSSAITVIHTGDEMESLSSAFAKTFQALARQRDRLKKITLRSDAIFDSLGEGAVVTDRQGRVIQANQYAVQQLGWQLEEALGKPWSEIARRVDAKGKFVPEKDRAITIAMEGHKRVRDTSHLYARKDGTIFPVSVTATPLKLDSQTLGAVLVFRDITQEKAVDRAKTEFVSLASHQLRTPLTAIQWYAELLLDTAQKEGRLSHSQKRDLERMSVRSRRMVQVVNDLLNVSRLDTGRLAIRPEPTNLADLIRSTIEELSPMASQHACEVIFHKPDEPESNIPVDRSLLRQVLHNLLNNAIKYSRQDGQARVWVQLERDALGKPLISVQDQGVGIPADLRSRVFEKFIRADNAMKMETEGTGLGLYMAKMIIDAGGGDIWFESIEGKGTTFYVRIPAQGMRERSGMVGLAEIKQIAAS